VLALLVEFCEEKLSRDAAKENPRRAMEAFCDLRTAVQTLVLWGHAEFEPTLKQIDGELLFLAETCRHKLLTDYLDATEERAVELYAMLIDLGSTGYWPTLKEDLDEELERREALHRERA
jgi:hypothetical protein